MTDEPQLPPLETVPGPGEYDIREDSYHADPCPEPSLSGSMVKVLTNRTPRHAWACHPRLNPDFERKHSDTFDLGTAVHKLVLEKGCELYPLDFPDWKTKDSRTERDRVRADGFIPLLKSQLERANAMAAAARAQVPLWEELKLAMAGGIPERTYVWQEETDFGPIYCRSMIDWTPHNGNLSPDWKTTEQGAGPTEWGAKTLWNLDAHIQAAFNARALKKVAGVDMELFFAVIETQFPHALCCMKPTPSSIAMANRDVERAIVTWAWCLKNSRWPGYRNQMAWVEPPPWKERGFLEREDRGELDMGQTIQLLEMAAEGRAELEPREPSADADTFGLEPVKELDA